MYALQESQFPIGFSALLDISPTGFQRQRLWSLISSVQVPLPGEQSGVKSPYSSGKTSIAVTSLLSVNCCTKGMGTGQTASPPPLPVWLCFFLCILYCRRSFLLVFSSFSEVTTLCMLCCAVLSRSVMSDFATPWTAALQAPPSMGFSRPEYWSG